jgi:ribosome-associated toxin RatA of RatAB toxin-antitoxin module
MYQLVNQVDSYPEFLDWCSNASILNQTEEQITATVMINKSAFNQSFTTINNLAPYKRIDMQLSDGPFSHLTGSWKFTELSNNACKVELQLQFSFSSRLTDIAISPIFSSIANSQLDAFVRRAKYIYG